MNKLQSPMATLRVSLLLFFVTFVIHISNKTTAQPSFLSLFCQNDIGNYTNSSDYKVNLNTLLSTLPTTDGNGYGFYNLSAGDGVNEARAVGLCRGDAEPAQCQSCLENATVVLRQRCPNQKEAVGWYDLCMLRYSNRSLAGRASGNIAHMSNPNNVTSEVGRFFENLQTLLNGLKNRAASGGPLRKYAAGNMTTPGFATVYGLVQCTPELTMQQCNNCLDDAFRDITSCCAGKQGGRVVGPSCNFRYESNLFYDPNTDEPSLPPVATPPSPPSPASINTTPTQAEARPLYDDDDDEVIVTTECLQYSFEKIRVATDNFDEANKVGQGGFGAVYKGRFPDGQVIVVKRLLRGSKERDLEFKNEVTLVARLQHRNLARLLGFCLEGSDERLLVYEFVPNRSLDHFVFDPSKRENLDWQKRYKIIGGIARGLLYLHEDSRLTIIHRDLKASNILLDEEMNPKIADFGSVRLFEVDQTQGNTKRIIGTYGYMAPEYGKSGKYSVKSDVFSFGVLLLEIVSGQNNISFRHEDRVGYFLSSAWVNWKDDTASNIVDPLLRGAPETEIMRCIHIALLCVQENVADRPTMSAIVLMLNNNSMSLPVPLKPGYFMHSSIQAGFPLDEVPENISVNNASITEPYPR